MTQKPMVSRPGGPLARTVGSTPVSMGIGTSPTLSPKVSVTPASLATAERFEVLCLTPAFCHRMPLADGSCLERAALQTTEVSLFGWAMSECCRFRKRIYCREQVRGRSELTQLGCLQSTLLYCGAAAFKGLRQRISRIAVCRCDTLFFVCFFCMY